jgi:hypothetical protein
MRMPYLSSRDLLFFLGDVELRASYDSILLLPVISQVVALLLSY